MDSLSSLYRCHSRDRHVCSTKFGSHFAIAQRIISVLLDAIVTLLDDIGVLLDAIAIAQRIISVLLDAIVTLLDDIAITQKIIGVFPEADGKLEFPQEGYNSGAS
jgi:hypothetical protein